MFENEKNHLPKPEFMALDRLFADVDEYVADPELRARVGGWTTRSCEPALGKRTKSSAQRAHHSAFEAVIPC